MSQHNIKFINGNKYRSILLMPLILFMFSYNGKAQDKVKTQKYNLKSIQAYLYYHEVGKIGNIDVTVDNTSLWNITSSNTVTSDGPSGNVFINTEVVGPNFYSSSIKNMKLQIEIKKQNSRYHKYEIIKLNDYFSEKKVISIPMLLRETGCGILDIKATLYENNKIISTMGTKIKFLCGE